MFAMTLSCALRGIVGVPVRVEADIAAGLPGFTVVGLTDRAIQEARERVRAAVRNAGLDFPARKLTVNLAPAELPKEGTAFDLAIALAVLRCAGMQLDLNGTALLGELALDATLRAVAGVLPMARSLRAAGVRRLVVPCDNATEAALIEGLEVVAAPSLPAAVAHLDGSRPLPRLAPAAVAGPAAADGAELAAVRGQATAKRALEIAAAGGHNLLMIGPPGAGKTMLARCLASLLPDLESDEALEVAAVYSLRGAFRERPAASVRPPFRAPHHSISRAGLVGGGSGLAQPGEISLASRGILFLDELCEFPRQLLEALRQPLEERAVTVVRARGSVSLPADFSLVAAANPCPCGHLDDPGHTCACAPRELTAYRSRLSGPLLDRIDLLVHVPRQSYMALFGQGLPEEPSAEVRRRVAAARARQRDRHSSPSLGPRRPPRRVPAAVSAKPACATGLPTRSVNAALDGRALLSACEPTAAASRLLARAGERLALSARAYHRVLRVARTVADLGAAHRVDEEHVAEALRYRGERVERAG